jgi:hypothetical protein
MNERTKKLAIIANPSSQEIYESDSWQFNCAAWSADDLEKFAELIVRECMKVSRSADGLDATHEAWYLIEQHFGLGMSTEDKKTLIKELLGVKE